MRRGEVWWVEAPEGRRPHLVLTRDPAIEVLNALLAVPATRRVRGIPTEVALGPEHGMPELCVLTLDNLSVVRRTMFRERICALDSVTMHRVCSALSYAAGCD